MSLSLNTDLALRALMFLVASQERGQIGEIAAFYAVSRDHLAKAVRRLSQEGFVRTIRGVGGGIELAKSPDEISIGEVIERLEGRMHLLDCVAIEGICCIQPGCKLRGVLREAERRQYDYLKSVRLSDVITPGQNLLQLTVPAVAGH